MIKNPVLLYKILVIGVVILFVGIGIQPAFAVTPDSSDIEENCDICQPVRKLHFIRLKSLIYRLGVLNNILLLLSKHTPELKKINEELSNKILDVINSNGIIWYVICKFLINFVESIKEFRDKYFGWAGYMNWWLTVISFSTYLFWKAYCPNQ